MQQATLKLDVQFDPEETDAESVAAALDKLLKMAMSIPDMLDEYGVVQVEEFLVEPETITVEVAVGVTHGDSSGHWYTDWVEIPADTPEDRIQEVAQGKFLAEYEGDEIVAFVVAYHIEE